MIRFEVGIGFLRFRFLPVESQGFGDPSLPGTETHISDSIVNWNRLESKAIEISFSLKKVAKSVKYGLYFIRGHYIQLLCAIQCQNMHVE